MKFGHGGDARDDFVAPEFVSKTGSGIVQHIHTFTGRLQADTPLRL